LNHDALLLKNKIIVKYFLLIISLKWISEKTIDIHFAVAFIQMNEQGKSLAFIVMPMAAKI